MKSKLKILITTYYFHPDITPRAFRAFELAREFSKQGHEVKVYTRDTGEDYSSLKDRFSVIPVSTGYLFNRSRKQASSASAHPAPKKSGIRSALIKLMRRGQFWVYPGGVSFEYGFTLSRALSQEEGQFDLLISIGLPIAVHFGSAMAVDRNPALAMVRIADYGDPFSGSSGYPPLPFRYRFEKWILDRFDHISIPIIGTRNLYKRFKPTERISIIPQGFDFSTLKLATYQKEATPRFAYAGIFYPYQKHPGFLFEYLCSLPIDFRFTLFTDINNQESMSLIEPYRSKLGEKLEIHHLIPRLDCIHELSRFDFLVNLEWENSIQRSSKVIDYALSGRPIISFSQEAHIESLFGAFLRGDYSDQLAVDLESYDIRAVAEKFITLT